MYRRAVFVILSAVLVLTSCGGDDGDEGAEERGTGTTQAEVAGPAAKVGAVFSQTNAAKVFGEAQVRAVKLAEKEINAGAVPGVRLELIVEDDGSSKDEGINVFNKLINQDQVVAIIGPTLSNTAQAADPLANEAKVPVLGVSNTAGGITEIGPYIWRDSLTEAQVIPAAVKAAKAEHDISDAVLFYGSDDAFTKSGGDVFRQALRDSGIRMLKEETFAKGDKDFSAQLTSAREAGPDALFVSALAEEAVGLLTQAESLGLDVPVVGGNGFNTPALAKNAGPAAEGVIVGAAWNSSADNPKSKAFIEAFEREYGSEPDQFAAQAYTGVYVIAEAIERGGGPERERVLAGLKEIRDLDTVLGSFSFTDGRDAEHPAVVQVINDGKFTVLETAGEGTS